MKNSFKQAALAVAMTLGAVAGASAAVSNVCGGCTYRFDGDGLAGDTAAAQPMAASYIGTYNPYSNFPFLGDKSIGLNHQGLGSDFTDWWAFQINPAGNAQWDLTFNPSDSITSFQSTLYEVSGLTVGSGSGSTCSAVTNAGGANAQAGFCGSIGTLGAIVAASADSAQHRWNGAALNGWYMVKVTGTIAPGALGDTGNGYSGNLTTRPMPEPGSLALAALGLLAAGVALRRKA